MKNLSKFLIAALIVIIFDWPCFGQGFYSSFSWDLFQSKDFVTIQKDQKEQGPCHIFAAVAQVESLYELLYFWPEASFDLSERHLYSPCIGAGQGFVPRENINPFIRDYGVVEENIDFPKYRYYNTPYVPPYFFSGANCSNPDGYYKYRITFDSINLGAFSTNKEIQDAIYSKGPINVMIISPLIHNSGSGGGGHSLLLHGWTKYQNRLYWVFKDSWPNESSSSYSVDADYLNLPLLYRNQKCEAIIITDVQRYQKVGSSWVLNNRTRSCNGDTDSDGYCFWGLGAKPCAHGSSLQQDFNDNDRTKGPLLTGGLTKGYAMPLPNLTAPVSQMVINGPNQTGHCLASHIINSNYWINSSDDYIDWVPYSGSTPTVNTGPDNNAPGATGLYLYLEPTGGCNNMKGILESKHYFYIPNSGYALKYYYHMYGTTMGTLKVKIQTYPDLAWVEYGTIKSGNKGLNWYNEVISLNQFSGRYIKIRFEGTTGSGEYSDMAIQNISIPYIGTKSTGTKGINDQANPEEQNQVFTLYPNPASSQLFINTTEQLDYHLSIYNTSGKLVYGKRLNSNQIIDVGTLPKGIYIVRIKYNDHGKKTYTEEIIIR